MTAFSTLNVLPPAQLTNLNELGYLTMTPVQAAALPAILAGKDVRVQAKTGSGKHSNILRHPGHGTAHGVYARVGSVAR